MDETNVTANMTAQVSSGVSIVSGIYRKLHTTKLHTTMVCHRHLHSTACTSAGDGMLGITIGMKDIFSQEERVKVAILNTSGGVSRWLGSGVIYGPLVELS